MLHSSILRKNTPKSTTMKIYFYVLSAGTRENNSSSLTSYQITCKHLSSVVSVVITEIDIIKISISKIEKFIWIINGKSIGPVDFITNNHCAHFAIHAGFFNSRVLAPVSPEHYMSTAKSNLWLPIWEKNLAAYRETLHEDS